MRERALGRYNIPNAICYANLARHMICMQDLATAESYHFQATELFSKWSADHPNSWIVMLSNGLCLSKKGDHEAAVLQLQKCLRIAQKGYSRNHINLLKIKLQYCLMLVKAEHFHESITSFEELAKELEL